MLFRAYNLKLSFMIVHLFCRCLLIVKIHVFIRHIIMSLLKELKMTSSKIKVKLCIRAHKYSSKQEMGRLSGLNVNH